EFTDAKNFQGRKYKLDSSRGHELESQSNELLLELNFSLINKKLNRYINDKNQNDLIKKQNKEEIKELKSKNTSLTEYKSKYYSKLEEANSFQSRIKSLEEELSLTQKYSSKKDSEIMTLKAELALKNDGFERLKLDTISAELAWPKSVITEGNEKNKLNKSLTKYFVPKKIDDKIQPSSKISLEVSNTEIGKDTQSGVSSIFNILEPIDTECQVQEKKNIIPYLTQ
ncbi:22468_t:CDS:2, partial [Gigaspora rosea]